MLILLVSVIFSNHLVLLSEKNKLRINMNDSINKLLRRQAALQRAILKLQQSLFEVQGQLNDSFIKSLKRQKTNDVKSKDIMTSSEVCDMLKISQSTLRRMELYKGFPYTRIPGQKKLIFSRKDIIEYLRTHKENNYG